MKRSLVRWMRVVLPNSDYAWACIIAEMMIEAIYLMIVWQGWPADELFFRNIRLGWLGFVACGYGISRVTLFHPAFNEQYRDWLASVPWTPAKVLPGGAVGLMPQDLIVLMGLVLLARETSLLILAIPLSFLVGYLSILAFTARICGDWIFAYLLGFGLGAIALVGQSVGTGCVVAAAFCPIALIAIQRSLKSFPWQIDWSQIKRWSQSNVEDRGRERLGWPNDFLSPKIPKVWLPYPDGVCLSLLAGWFAFVIEWHGGTPFVLMATPHMITFASIIRVAVYMRAHRWPINLWGRIWTMRWIIPGYDVIYVAPLLSIAIISASQVGAALVFGRFAPARNPANWGFEWVTAACSCCGISAALMTLLVMGPVLERWCLVGQHRIIFDASSKQSMSPFVEL